VSDLITSTQNNRIKLAKSLQERARARRKEKKFVLEGTRLINDALSAGQTPHFIIYEPDTADYELIAVLQSRNIELLPVSKPIMNHISDTQQPQGVAGVFTLPYPPMPEKANRVLILDAVTEPGNMGTILRTAAAAGVQLVVLAPGCVDPYNPKVLRGGMGAHFRVPIVESGWSGIEMFCQNMNIYAAAGEAEASYDTVNWRDDWALIVGSEAHGISDDARKTTLTEILIPMAADTESLNVAVAAGIILFEAARQNR